MNWEPLEKKKKKNLQVEFKTIREKNLPRVTQPVHQMTPENSKVGALGPPPWEMLPAAAASWCSAWTAFWGVLHAPLPDPGMLIVRLL